jgi:hypothetical protein
MQPYLIFAQIARFLKCNLRISTDLRARSRTNPRRGRPDTGARRRLALGSTGPPDAPRAAAGEAVEINGAPRSARSRATVRALIHDPRGRMRKQTGGSSRVEVTDSVCGVWAARRHPACFTSRVNRTNSVKSRRALAGDAALVEYAAHGRSRRHEPEATALGLTVGLRPGDRPDAGPVNGRDTGEVENDLTAALR